MTINRPILKIYDYGNTKKAELHSAFNIVESKQFGSIPELSFRYPVYLIDANGNNIYDADGIQQTDTKIYTIRNEMLVEFNDDWYVIKNVTEGRNSDGAKYITAQCNGKAGELSFKQIPFLNLSPPISPTVDAKRGILEVITYPHQADLGYGIFTAVSGSTVTLAVTGTTFDFTGYKIVTLDGTGKYQQRKIVSYVVGTRVATLESAFSPQVLTSTLYRIHNSKYDLGTVDALLINDGANIFRALKFEDVSILDALSTVAARFNGNLVYVTTWNTTYSEFRTTVSLKLPYAYNNYEFRYQKNLKGVERVVDSTNGCYTRLYPEGRNNLSVVTVPTSLRTDSATTYVEHELNKGDIYNFQFWLAQGYTLAQCKDLFIKDFRFIEDAYTDANMLFDGAKKALNELSLPKISYNIAGVDLSTVFPEYAYVSLQEGDMVRVVDNDLGFDFNATIIKKNVDWDKPYLPNLELSNFIDNFGHLYYKMLKYNENYAKRYSLYGKSATVVIADQLTSRNWRYADYIVPSDGSVTASKVIQSAIDEVSTNGGGTIVLSDGQYKITTTLVMKSNVDLTGNGVATRLYPSSNSVGLCITATGAKNISIMNLFIDYARQADGTSLLYYFTNGIGIYSGSDNVLVEYIIQEYVDNNMFIAVGCSNISIRNSIYQSKNLVFNGTDGIDIKGCNNFTIENVNFLGSFSNANNGVIAVVDQVGVTKGKIIIRNNYMEGGMSNVFSAMIFVNVSDNVSIDISNNILLSSGTSSIYAGIYSGGNDMSIVNNSMIGNFYWGIQVTTKSTTAIANVLNNQVKCNGVRIVPSLEESCIYITGTALGFGRGNIQGNSVKKGNIYNSSTTPPKYGIYISPNCTNVMCSNNDASDSGVTASLQNNGVGTLLLGGNKL